MLIDILTTFPETFTPLESSIVGRAREKGIVEIRFFNPRDYSLDPHRKTDDRQYGGADGMVMTAPPLLAALDAALESPRAADPRVVLTSPQGKPFDQAKALEYSRLDRLVVVCGHYKGVDERFVDLARPEEVSLGDFVLTGGEIAAMAIVDATVRLLPEAVNRFGSVEDDSFYDGVLDCPRYTRPRVVRGMEVPGVLLSGNHEKIEAWRRRMALEATRRKRPELLGKAGTVG